MKISNLGGSCIAVGGGSGGTGTTQLWLDCQKMTTAGTALLINGPRASEVWANVSHFETSGTPASPVSLIKIQHALSKLFLNGGEILAGSTNFAGIEHNAGATHATGVRIDLNAANDADNKPVILGGAGMILDGCTLLAPALADSIYSAAAQTVKIYGTTYTNKAKHANVTVQAGLGTLVADANVS